eukprot:TRINITY_DN460_c0_g2_i1.p1 TRINITY_DN460_c0_g2~~TRINITY_DN460_c0_g2_i1.p1  ORF type:complete len:461 (+),score=152.45 TRINITY_DN460_c0_g2_i1:132-1514(+)
MQPPTFPPTGTPMPEMEEKKTLRLFMSSIPEYFTDENLEALLSLCTDFVSFRRIFDPVLEIERDFGFCEFSKPFGARRLLEFLKRHSSDLTPPGKRYIHVVLDKKSVPWLQAFETTLTPFEKAKLADQDEKVFHEMLRVVHESKVAHKGRKEEERAEREKPYEVDMESVHTKSVVPLDEDKMKQAVAEIIEFKAHCRDLLEREREENHKKVISEEDRQLSRLGIALDEEGMVRPLEDELMDLSTSAKGNEPRDLPVVGTKRDRETTIDDGTGGDDGTKKFPISEISLMSRGGGRGRGRTGAQVAGEEEDEDLNDDARLSRKSKLVVSMEQAELERKLTIVETRMEEALQTIPTDGEELLSFVPTQFPSEEGKRIVYEMIETWVGSQAERLMGERDAEWIEFVMNMVRSNMAGNALIPKLNYLREETLPFVTELYKMVCVELLRAKIMEEEAVPIGTKLDD